MNSGTEADLSLNICCAAQQISENFLRSGALLGQRTTTQPPPHSAEAGGGRIPPRGLCLGNTTEGSEAMDPLVNKPDLVPEFLRNILADAQTQIINH